MMAAATVIERLYGTNRALSIVYHSPVFIVLWAVSAISGVLLLIRRGTIRKPATFFLHISFVLILAGADMADAHAVKLDFLQVTTGKGVKSVASIGLDISGQKFEAAASGNGPVDAAIKGLKKIIMKQMTLKEFTIQAISKGSDDVGKVHMQVEYNGSLYYGFGANTDIVTASVEAYIDCINKFKKED